MDNEVNRKSAVPASHAAGDEQVGVVVVERVLTARVGAVHRATPETVDTVRPCGENRHETIGGHRRKILTRKWACTCTLQARERQQVPRLDRKASAVR